MMKIEGLWDFISGCILSTWSRDWHIVVSHEYLQKEEDTTEGLGLGSRQVYLKQLICLMQRSCCAVQQ